jgi:hypothetical protein
MGPSGGFTRDREIVQDERRPGALQELAPIDVALDPVGFSEDLFTPGAATSA